MIEVIKEAGGIRIDGHANFAPVGQDIVCAGVSILVQNLIQSIENLTEDKIEYDMQPGMVYIKHGILSERAQVLLNSFFVGIEMIADEYPHHVKLTKH